MRKKAKLKMAELLPLKVFHSSLGDKNNNTTCHPVRHENLTACLNNEDSDQPVCLLEQIESVHP